MTRTISILFLLCSFCRNTELNAQGLELESSLSEYSVGDTVYLEFKSILIPDSLVSIINTGCYVLPEQKTSKSIIINNGNRIESYHITLKVVFLNAGVVSFHPPTLVKESKINRGNDVVLKINKGKLTDEEVETLKRNLLTHNEEVVIGAKRYTLLSNSGYIEEYTAKGWKFKRGLTEQEFQLYSK